VFREQTAFGRLAGKNWPRRDAFHVARPSRFCFNIDQREGRVGGLMGKVRVGHAVAQAYGFVVRRFFIILGFSWLPALALAALGTWWLMRFGADARALSDASGARWRLGGETLTVILAGLLFASAVCIPLIRLASGETLEGALARFVIGKREIRLFLASLQFIALALTALMIVAVLVATAIDSGLAHAVAAILPGPKTYSTDFGEMWRGIVLQDAVAEAGLGLAAIVTIALVLRLGFFLAPLAAADEPSRIARAARLSRGSFWRLLAIILAIGVPVSIAFGAVAFLIVGGTSHAGSLHAFYTGAPQTFAGLLAANAVAIAAVGTGAFVLFLAMFAAASAAAYRDRRDGVEYAPERSSRTEIADQRDKGTPFEGGMVPALASVHPLATLLPGETAPAASAIGDAITSAPATHAIEPHIERPLDAIVDVVPELSVLPSAAAASQVSAETVAGSTVEEALPEQLPVALPEIAPVVDPAKEPASVA
jgi:hypothetical protein